jgi:hypothetical protein
LQSQIQGISRSSLWLAWKEIRPALRNATVRDVIDYLDYDIDPEVWIRRLLRNIESGTYEPQAPTRFSLAKAGGFKRRLTVPTIPDLVLYRAIADLVHRRAQRYQQPHVYYRRSNLQQAVEEATKEAREDLQKLSAEYRFTSARSFRNWLDYEQYRKQLILKKIYPCIVTTDITNFFDSVLHSEVATAFRQFPVPSRLVGILFFVMERLAVRADYSDSPRIGLPVDEFECSRTIANLVLFPHDRRVVELVGKDSYVRWMDDQVIGVNSRAEGLRTVSAVGDSLAKLYLTANAKKTRILSLREARIHFHLDANAAIDSLEEKILSRAKSRKALVRELGRVWRSVKQHKDKGEWEKIQQRIYRLAGLTKAKVLRTKAVRDIIKSPALTARIADYMRCSGSAAAYLTFVTNVLRHKEQIHDDVKLLMTESLLRLELKGIRARSILKMAIAMLEEIGNFKRHFVFAAPACLLVVRFGDRRSKSRLRRCFEERVSPKPPQLVRAAAIAYATYGRNEFAAVKRAAAVLLSNPLALMVRMVRRLQKLDNVPVRFKSRLSVRLDSVSGRHYVDMRTLVSVRLLSLNRRNSVRVWLKEWVNQAKRKKISSFDKKLLAV